MSGDVEVEDWQWVIGWWCGSLGGMGEGWQLVVVVGYPSGGQWRWSAIGSAKVGPGIG